MRIEELRLFRKLTEELHFGRTSKACNITPSALSRTIQRLEEEIGQQLLYRDNRTVVLTEAGRRMAAFTDDVLRGYQDLMASFPREEDSLAGELSIYCSVTAVHSILPGLLKGFRQQYPDIHLNLHTGDAAEALQRVEEGNIDLAIAARPDTLPGTIEFMSLVVTPLVFIGPCHYQDIMHYHADGTINYEETPLVMAERGLSRTRLETWFRQQHLRPLIDAQVSGNEAVISLVSLGSGIGVVPELVLDKSPLKEEVFQLEGAPVLKPYEVGICVSRRRLTDPLVQAF